MTLYKWSQTANSNQGADPTVNWTEGQAPSSLNDSARAMMAATAKYRDDTAGHTQTGGTASAYTFASSQGFTSTTDLNGQEITFIAGATNAQGVTFNVDGVGAFPLAVVSSGALVPAGSLAAGGVYTATFYSSISQWLLRDFYVNPFNIPLGGMMDYICASVPNSNFVFPIGQAISRTTYAALFAQVGTTYGAGDGSTTFNIPDLRGRTVAGTDNMGGSVAGRLTSASGMGNGFISQVGGGETSTLLTANLPPYTPAGTITNGAITSTTGALGGVAGTGQPNTGQPIVTNPGAIAITSTQAASTFAGSAQGGASTPFRTVQPTIVLNKILRII